LSHGPIRLAVPKRGPKIRWSAPGCGSKEVSEAGVGELGSEISGGAGVSVVVGYRELTGNDSLVRPGSVKAGPGERASAPPIRTISRHRHPTFVLFTATLTIHFRRRAPHERPRTLEKPRYARRLDPPTDVRNSGTSFASFLYCRRWERCVRQEGWLLP
jgi:hypothetical protein